MAPMDQVAGSMQSIIRSGIILAPGDDSAEASWNIFRYAGDFLQLSGIVVVLVTIIKNSSVQGVSRGTQLLYLLIFLTRYVDLAILPQTGYGLVFKATHLVTSVLILALFMRFDKTYEQRYDTWPLSRIVLASVAATVLFSNEYSTLEVSWAFSKFVESCALVPQYIFCYREQTAKDWGPSIYVMAIGGHQVLYALNLVYKTIQIPEYSDMHSWLSGKIAIALFVDFLNFKLSGQSMLFAIIVSIKQGGGEDGMLGQFITSPRRRATEVEVAV